MDKISGILPSSARVSAVDLKDAAPVRPGTPSFGRPEGVSSLKTAAVAAERAANATQFETASKSAGIQREMSDWRSKDAAQAKVVTDVSNSFFMKNTSRADEAGHGAGSGVVAPSKSMKALSFGDESTPAGFKTDELGSFQALEHGGFEPEEAEPTLKQPEGLYPKGSFIDRAA